MSLRSRSLHNTKPGKSLVWMILTNRSDHGNLRNVNESGRTAFIARLRSRAVFSVFWAVNENFPLSQVNLRVPAIRSQGFSEMACVSKRMEPDGSVLKFGMTYYEIWSKWNFRKFLRESGLQ